VRDREAPDPLGSHDGVLSGAWTQGLLAEEFSSCRLYSASQFDEYARCPFAFYLKYLLGVEPPQPPPERMEPVEIGAICHQALAQVHRRCTLAGKPARDNLEYARQELEEVLGQLFGDELLTRLGIGRALAEAYRSETLELLTPVLSLGPEGDYVPGHFELAFGQMPSSDVDPASRAEPLALDIGRERVFLRGRIDRVDVGPGSFAIMDYKLGETPGATAFREGSHLQLALYLTAAEELLFPGQRCEEAGFVSLSRATVSFPIRREPAHRAVSADEAKQLVKQYLSAYVNDMRQGLFPPVPMNDRACAKCPFAPCCRREHTRVERKLGPAGRTGFLGLPGAETGGTQG
jgi:ATP-dependent helicase/nuclease subunit B